MWAISLDLRDLVINRVAVGYTRRHRLLPGEPVKHNIDNTELLTFDNTGDLY